MKKISRILATIAFVLSIIYIAYVYKIIYEASSDTAIASLESFPSQFTPHIIATALAILMNGVGLVFASRWFILSGAIFYTAALILLPGNLLFVIIQAILLFIAFAIGKPEREVYL